MILNHKFMRRWIKALRDGTYRQARGYLRTGDGYCCLGVECDLVNSRAWGSEVDCSNVTLFKFDEHDVMFPPNFVRERSGLPTWIERVLSEMNDGAVEFCGGPSSFDEIADVLELALLMDKDGCLPASAKEAYDDKDYRHWL